VEQDTQREHLIFDKLAASAWLKIRVDSAMKLLIDGCTLS
jgi:hypothetical protein